MSVRAKKADGVSRIEALQLINAAASDTVNALLAARESAAAAAKSDANAAKAALITAEQVEKIPKPVPADPRDGIGRGLLSAEEGTWARLNPRRSRWPALNRIDERVAELDRRRAALVDEIAVVNEQRATAEQRHADQLTAWYQDGERGERPSSDATVLDERLPDLRAEHAAVETLSEQVLAEKIAHVKKHRRSLVRTSTAEAAKAKVRYEQTIDELERARSDLVDARQTELWAQAFPSEHLNVTAPTYSLAGGVKSVCNRWFPEVTSDLPAAAMLGLLKDDATFLSSMITHDLKAASLGVRPELIRDDVAVWGGSEEDLARQEREKTRARERHTTTFGLPPAEYKGG